MPRESLLGVALGAILLQPLLAQKAPRTEFNQKLAVDSTYLHNDLGAERVVFDHLVRWPGAPWMRLFFDQTHLPAGSWLRLTSIADQVHQRLDAGSLIDYGNASCFLNGEAVRVELIAGPNTRANRVRIVSATVGAGVAETICGPNDDRKQSLDPFSCRFDGVCSGWLCGIDAVGSAGHCISPSRVMLLEFNVPPSTSGGSRRSALPQDQYPTVQGTAKLVNGGVGADWGVSRVGKNSNTGLLPGQAQKGWYFIGSVPATTAGQNVRVTGYGTSTIRTLNQVQKTHVGPLHAIGATSLQHRSDTTGGNSGSPIIQANTGLLIGVHTHGGCTGSGGANWGTRIDETRFLAALKSLIGRAGLVTAYGAGCAGSSGTPVLDVIGAPEIGRTITLRTKNLPPSTQGLQFLGLQQASVDLSIIGLKGCVQLTSLDAILGLPSNGTGVAELSARLPYHTGMVGLSVFAQHAADDPTTQSTVASNGAKLTIGFR